MREIVLDTETTGLSPDNGDRVVEIGCVELINHVPTSNTFQVYLNPEKQMDPGAEKVHGLTNEFLVDKPKFIDVADDFLSFIGSSTLVAHNADFDVGFLNSELSRAKKEKIKTNRVVDTLKIARTKYPGARNSLDALCKRFSIDNSNRELHGALLDSELLAEVYLELVGGKEPNFELSSITRSPVNRINKSYISQLSRKKKLEPRISEADEKNHKEFLLSFPKQSIWLKNG
ncbi:MAG: DNA polymerase III subunit epsilon [Rhizobiales bacterium TMED168]|nr:MAG: DNA polymerase III subunit epsilon [Rhizobiales bacterium TMED168]|tara:strand:+ start:24874 stop:25566 length:693 start_codon:yes stop_codon:yes gene_type:complete